MLLDGRVATRNTRIWLLRTSPCRDQCAADELLSTASVAFWRYMVNGPAPLVFINYRDADEPWAAAAIDDELTDQFGTGTVFLDCRSIVVGQSYTGRLQAGLRSSSVLLVVIGRHWLTITDCHGRRLIDRHQDWVRWEIAEALASGIHVIPVLVDDVGPPGPDALPASIRRLSRCQYLRLRHRHRYQDVAHLAYSLLTIEPRLGTAGVATQNDCNDEPIAMRTVDWPPGSSV